MQLVYALHLHQCGMSILLETVVLQILLWDVLFCLLIALNEFILITLSIGSGTSQEGSGMVGTFKSSSERKIVRYSVDLLKQLQLDGHDVGKTSLGMELQK